MEQSYKEKYEDILARLAKAKNDNDVCDERFCCVIDGLIPELAESEDEKIRKRLITDFGTIGKKEWGGLEVKDILAWLENIPYTIDHEKREGFHLGYKAGLERLEMKSAAESLGVDSETYNKIVDECIFGEQNLAENTKPQSSTPMSYGKELEKRMCEACNRFFAPNTDSNRYSASDLFYAGVKAERDLNTLAWSEEDEINVYNIIHFLEEPSMLENNEPCKKIVIDWLKSLKDRVQPKQEWSEEDEQHIDSLLKRLDALCRNKFERTRFAISEDRDWLKSLRPRSTWKPSDEQMDALRYVTNFDYGGYESILVSLYEQLKKL